MESDKLNLAKEYLVEKEIGEAALIYWRGSTNAGGRRCPGFMSRMRRKRKFCGAWGSAFRLTNVNLWAGQHEREGNPN